MDTTGDGQLDHIEFHKAMQRLGLGVSPTQIDLMIKQLDPYHEGAITYHNFVQHLLGTSRALPPASHLHHA